jgi:hypothetical protein
MGKQAGRSSAEAKKRRNLGDSQYSHVEYGSTRGNWDREASPEFAVTSVNVPDRLDTQEVRARAAVEDSQPSVSRFHREDVLRVGRWVVGLLVLAAAVWWAMRIAVPLREAISPTGVESRISKALGVPVSVADTEFRLLPAPRLVIRDLTAQSGFRLPAVTLDFNWRDAWRGLQTSTWVLGEARVAPLKVSAQEALALLQALRGASGLPAGVSTVRFESVTFGDLPLLPGRYEAVLRRGAGQRDFGPLSLKGLDGKGQVDIEITPPAAGGNAKFALYASDWVAPAGPAVAWNDATAQGEFNPDAVRVDAYSVRSRFGVLNGAGAVTKEARGWRVAGNVRGPDVAVEEVIRLAAGLGDDEASLARVPLRGTAKFDLVVSGTGATAEDALRRATAAGAVSVANASLVGVNLGLAATQGDATAAGGVTRFTDLELDVVGSSEGLAVRSLAGRAGGLRVSGGFNVDRKMQISGSLRPEVALPGGSTAAQIRLGGTAAKPSFQ